MVWPHSSETHQHLLGFGCVQVALALTAPLPEGIHKFSVLLLLHMLDTSHTGCIIRVLPPTFSVGGRTLSCILSQECEQESCENSTLWSTSSATDHPSQLPSLT